jgi:hypothetical protein
MALKTKSGDGIPLDDDVNARIEELKKQAAAPNDGPMRTYMAPDCPDDLDLQFWEQMVAFENASEVEPLDLLIRSGLAVPRPEALDDAALTAKLWEVIHGLASLGVYLSFTDHLSDRELYARLWSDVLRTPTQLLPDSDVACHIDLTGDASDEGIAVYLRYYADEEDRRTWAEDWPEDPMPDVAPLPFDRDRHLPKAFYEFRGH